MSDIRAASCDPLFIVGCGRSGTTMLREMINAHPAYAIPGESHFIPEMWRRSGAYLRGPERSLDERSLVRDVLSIPQVRHWDITEEGVWTRLREQPTRTFGSVIEAVFQAYADSRGKRSWGDKTPVYVLHIPLLARLFPRARFVHIIRDGRDVALSYLSVPLSVRTIWEAARRWRRDVTAGVRHGGDLPSHRYVEVRYEALVSDPVPVLQQVSRFAGIRYSKEMLEYPERYKEKRKKAPDPLGLHAAVTKPPTVGLRDWRTQMPDDQIAAFEAVAGPLLVKLGYERRFSEVPGSMRLQAPLRLAAIELKASGSRAKKRARRALRARAATRG